MPGTAANVPASIAVPFNIALLIRSAGKKSPARISMEMGFSTGVKVRCLTPPHTSSKVDLVGMSQVIFPVWVVHVTVAMASVLPTAQSSLLSFLAEVVTGAPATGRAVVKTASGSHFVASVPPKSVFTSESWLDVSFVAVAEASAMGDSTVAHTRFTVATAVGYATAARITATVASPMTRPSGLRADPGMRGVRLAMEINRGYDDVMRRPRCFVAPNPARAARVAANTAPTMLTPAVTRPASRSTAVSLRPFASAP